MTLTNSDIAELITLRRDLHRTPDLSGEEAATSKRILFALSAFAPDELITGLGGHGIAAIYEGGEPGPTVLFRCELDALPIHETGQSDYRSETDGKGHLCGHDGHMAILSGLARRLSRQRPAQGRAVLLFQPAEETGAGAAEVIADPKYAPISPDYAFSLHNMPGLPLGAIGLAEGPVNCASRGLHLTLTGKSAHASNPESGTSPMAAVATLMPALTGLGQGTLGQPDFKLATVTHLRMGEPAFGIAPGEATLYATLRTLTDDGMDDLVNDALTLITHTADRHGLAASHSFEDVFLHSENDAEATAILRRALDTLAIPHDTTGQPWRASEDFGRFGHTAKSAMFLLGAGETHAALHNPDYDFPDDLIAPGVKIFEQVARDLLG
ncbi:MAG: amidohydrolase [Roseovarius sp.]